MAGPSNLTDSNISILVWAGLRADPTSSDEAAESDANEKYTFPEKADAINLIKRFYEDDAPLNAARALDGNVIIDVVTRNAGTTSSDSTSGSPSHLVIEPLIVPSPDVLVAFVWNVIPKFMKDKIRAWAKDKKNGGTIAREITEYVKQALSLLPIPVPGIFINFAANLAIPPLVTYIINHIAELPDDEMKPPKIHKRLLESVKSVKSHKINQEVDREILLRAGLPGVHLPSHLSPSDSVKGYPCVGQPDHREAVVEIKQFYSGEKFNGCKPLHLAQVLAAQCSLYEKEKDKPTVDNLTDKVLKTIENNDKETDPNKKKEWVTTKELKTWARKSPPAKSDIAQGLYDPLSEVLSYDYSVPAQILPAFTSMKLPQVTAQVIEKLK